MSGGSHNYLFLADSIEQLASQRDDLERMAARLGGLGWAQGAAAETYNLLSVLSRLDARLRGAEDLRNVWHAIEWWDSGDNGEEQTRRLVSVYEDVAR